jgi:hypothetical protein
LDKSSILVVETVKNILKIIGSFAAARVAVTVITGWFLEVMAAKLDQMGMAVMVAAPIPVVRIYPALPITQVLAEAPMAALVQYRELLVLVDGAHQQFVLVLG